MSYTGVTINTVYPHHNPNEGRDIWNRNFQNVKDAVIFSITGSTTAHTEVYGSSNITVLSSGATVPQIYTTYLNEDIIINSLSSNTISGNSLNLISTSAAQLIMQPVNAIAPIDGSMWFTTSGGTTLLNYQVSGITKSVELT